MDCLGSIHRTTKHHRTTIAHNFADNLQTKINKFVYLCAVIHKQHKYGKDCKNHFGKDQQRRRE